MKHWNFKIENRELWVSHDQTIFNDFAVESVPRPYRVSWRDDLSPIDDISNLMVENKKNLLLIDKNVYDLYCKELDIPESRMLKVEAIESKKTLESVLQLIEFLTQHQFTKADKLIVVGGGITQDIGAFAGACYKRGIPWVYFPTTLLSMCDSCIGGKTCINHGEAKNQLALFSSPCQVNININFLKTLSEREIHSGIGEILKLHIIGGSLAIEHYNEFISDGLAGKIEALKPLILGALSIKKAVIEEDEFELNIRKALNYGHTIGHAIEAMSDFRISHGQAIAIGMLLINELSFKNSMISSHENLLLKKLCMQLISEKLYLEMRNISNMGIGNLLKQDKKTMGNIVNFIMPKSTGDMRFISYPINEHLEQMIYSTIKREFY